MLNKVYVLHFKRRFGRKEFLGVYDSFSKAQAAIENYRLEKVSPYEGFEITVSFVNESRDREIIAS